MIKLLSYSFNNLIDKLYKKYMLFLLATLVKETYISELYSYPFRFNNQCKGKLKAKIDNMTF